MGKKKVTKKERAKIDAEQAEVKRIELEKLKQKQVEDELEQRKRDIEMAEERRQQEIVENNLRNEQLQRSLEYFQEFHGRIEEIQENLNKQQDWERYMRCKGLPNVNQAGDLRKYIHLWRENEIQASKNERNWLLQTNEKTLLTQNKDIPNLTVANVKAAQQNIGIVYAERVREVLNILDELQSVITDPSSSMSDFTLKDLVKIRTEIRVNLESYLDQMTFNILRNIDRDMKMLENSPMAVYLFESNIFKTQINTVRDIPQPQLTAKEKLKEESRHIEIEFELLKLHVNLPPTIKLVKSAIRALWLKFDHSSDYCSSYFMPTLGNAIAKPKNLAECSKLEWRKRKEIKEIANNEINKSDPVNSSTIENVSNVIDVDKIYSEFEEEQLANKKKLKGPENLNLRKTEINLRSHRIVGGIYGIDYLEQPKQNIKISNTRAYLTTILQSTLTKKIFYQSYSPPPPPQPGVRRLPEEIEAEIKQMEQNLDKLVLVNIQLSDSVLWFEPPLVCRWEYPDEYEAEAEQMKPAVCTCSSKLKSSKKNRKPKSLLDFNVLDIPPHIDLYEVMSNYIMPRIPDGYRIKTEALNTNRRGSLVVKEEKLKLQKIKFPTSLEDLIEPTNSPRTLHPVNQCVKSVKILKNFEEANEVYVKNSDEDENDQEAEDSKWKKIKIKRKKGVYMFSELLKDLDEVRAGQRPQFDTRIAELLEQDSENEGESSFPNLSHFLKKESPLLSSKNSPDPASLKCDYCLSGQEDRPNMGHWSNRDVHDVKFNEDKLTIQFRTGRLGYFGLAANRYSNLPFQTWELKPLKTPNTVNFTLTAAVVSVDITITEEGLRLNSLQGCSNTPLQHIIGKFLTLDSLKTILKGSAIDLFPEEDAFCYTEGSCEKHMIMESHLYDCIGAVALSHNFSWSRWNLLAGSRNAVLLMREFVEHRKAPSHSTLLVTPLKTTIVDCTEVSASFNTASAAGMEYYADLYHLTQHHSHPSSKRKQSEMDLSLRENVVQILKSIRPLSFC